MVFLIINACQIVPDSNVVNFGEAVIGIQLKANQKVVFSYYDSLFELKELKFSNPGNTDTLITKKLWLSTPVILNWNIALNEPKGNVKKFLYSVLVMPNDSISLSTSHNLFISLQTNEGFLRDTSDTFFSDNFYPLVSKANFTELTALKKEKISISFLTNLDEAFLKQKKKINAELGLGNIDSLQYLNKIWMAKCYYYKSIFVTASDLYPDNKMLINRLKRDQDSIEFLVERVPAITYDFIQVLFGLNEMKRSLTDFGNPDGYWSAFNELLDEKENRNRLPMLLYMLNAPKRMNDIEYKKATEDFVARFPSKQYYVDSIRLAAIPVVNKKNEDKFLTTSGEKLKWEDLIKENGNDVVVIDVWASWCAPCRALFPVIDSLKNVLKSSQIQIVSLNIDESKEDWLVASGSESKYLKQNNFHIENAKESYFVKTFRIESIPRIIVMKGGKVLSADFLLPTDDNFVKQLRVYSQN